MNGETMKMMMLLVIDALRSYAPTPKDPCLILYIIPIELVAEAGLSCNNSTQ